MVAGGRTTGRRVEGAPEYSGVSRACPCQASMSGPLSEAERGNDGYHGFSTRER